MTTGISSTPFIDQGSEIATNLERRFNKLACIPLVAIVSSAVRSTIATAQMVAGLILAGIGLLGQLIHKSDLKFDRLTSVGGEHALHGLLNSFRATGEFFLSLTLVGSLFLFIQKDYEPVIPYTNRQS
jgi:hypothetical protein